jgi:hypothetical protein
MKKKILLAIIIAFAIYTTYIFIIATIDYYDVAIHVFKLNDEPYSYFNMTSQQLNDFPHLNKVLIQGEGWIKTPRDEFNRLHNFLYNYDEWVIKFDNEYYEIMLATP